MRKLILFLLFSTVFLSIDVYIAHRMEPDARTPKEAVQKAGAELLAQVLAHEMKWRMKLPQKVDKMTQLVNIHAERNMVIYSMDTTADGGDFDRIMDEIHNHLDETSCQREDYQKMLKFGLAIALGFRSPSGKEAVPVMITPHMCGMDK